MTVTRLRTRLILFPILLNWLHPICGEETEKSSDNRIEAPSPDGKFAFRYTKEAKSESDLDSDSNLGKQTYDLIDKRSGKVLASVAESDPDLGPSARFDIEGVLWRADSKAFALTAMLWKPGSSVSVFIRNGSAFREIELPDLLADVPQKVKRGKSFPHVNESNSQSAIRWQKDGSLVVEIETMVDGNDGSITATRTVALGFDRPGKARILNSSIKFETPETDPEQHAEKLEQEGRTAINKGDLNAAIAALDRVIKLHSDNAGAHYYRGCAYFMKRDWAKALSDFQHHCDLRKEEEYQVFAARFYIWLIRARLGDREAADRELAPYMEGHPPEWSNGWDAKTGNFLLGRISEDDFLLSLNDNPGTAWFYAGMIRLLSNDMRNAAEDFRKSMAMGEKKQDVEVKMAAAELKALTK
jgi:tetratricopeptide (TPR) repeat protein